MNKPLFRVLALFLIAATSCTVSPAFAQNAPAKAAPAKPTFVSKKYGFSIYLPRTPQTKKQPLPAHIGGGSTDVYFVMPQPASYSVVPITLPAAASGLARKMYFDSVQQGILMSSKGKLIGARDILVNGQTARDFQWSFATPTAESKAPIQFAGRTRIYKVGRRTLQFTAIIEESKRAANRAQISKVLDSIQIAK